MLQVRELTGYKSNSPIICIFRNGKPFYAKTNKSGNISFNMPIGTYDVLAGELTKLNKPLKYELIKLPNPTKFIKFPERIKIHFGENPHKCSVRMGKYQMDVYFDNSFKDADFYELMWIMGHECGHSFYGGCEVGTPEYFKNEGYCDDFAANIMLIIGYNPSQIDAAIKQAISNGFHSKKRKESLYQNLIKIKTL